MPSFYGVDNWIKVNLRVTPKTDSFLFVFILLFYTLNITNWLNILVFYYLIK